MINERDTDILMAFLNREADMYRWKADGNDKVRRQKFIDRMFEAIVNFEDEKYDYPGFNYIHIQSISNMGLLTSELVLSGDPWDFNYDLYCLLPPSPKGGIGFRVEDHGI